MAGGNGVIDADLAGPKSQAAAERELTGEPLSLDYRPGLFAGLGYGTDCSTSYFAQVLWDVERMLPHPAVESPYSYYKGGVSNVDFVVKLKSGPPAAAPFVYDFMKRFWDRHLGQAQLSYDYGWCGYELSYRSGPDGLLSLATLLDFHPLDCYALTRDGRYRGVSVHGLGGVPGAGGGGAGGTRLRGPGRWPSKALWLVHNRRFHRFYGRSQLTAAWRPWRRLAARDGAEEVTDGAVYRHGVGDTIVRFPPEDMPRGPAGGMDRDRGREKAREMVESLKANASLALPNTWDEHAKAYKWTVERPTSVLDVNPLTNHCDYLKKEISCGIGVPPELLEASETGSGFSGRKIPLLGFYATQMGNARYLVHALRVQCLDGLVRWNFGPCEYEVEVKLVLPADMAGGGEGADDAKGKDKPGAPGKAPPGPGAGPGPGGPPGQMLSTEGHDVSGEKRDEGGRWAEGGAAPGTTPAAGFPAGAAAFAPPPGAGKVTVGLSDREEVAVAALVKKLKVKGLDAAGLAALAGAPGDADVEVRPGKSPGPPPSRSLAVFGAYMEERQKRQAKTLATSPGGTGAPGKGRAEIDLNEAEEAALERAWARVGPELRARRGGRELATDAGEPHSFGSTQLNLPAGAAGRLRAMAAAVPDGDLAQDGREDEFHVTALFGLHADVGPEDVRRAVAGFGPVAVTLGGTSVFPASEAGGEYDVVKVDVDSPDLHRLHGALAALPHTDTHPRYVPHITLAYLRPGLGAKYAGDGSAAGTSLSLDTLVFSAADGTRAEIPLGTSHSDPDADDARAIAEMYAGLWNALESAGLPVPDAELEAADAELDGTGWHVAREGGGPWRAEGPGAVTLSAGGHDVSGEPRDDKGEWAKGGAGGKPKPARRRDAPWVTALHLPEHVGDVADSHYRNMRTLLGRMARGEYSPHDVAEDVESYRGGALRASRVRHKAFKDHLAGRVGQKYGAAALASPEWQAVLGAVRASRDAAAAHIDDMADSVKAVAEYFEAHPGEPVRVRKGSDDAENPGRIHDDMVKTAHAEFNKIFDAVDALKAGHKAVELSTAADLELPRPATALELSTAHAPKGGVTINGVRFAGGRFIPGAALEHATPEVKAEVEAANAAPGARRRARGDVGGKALRGRLGAHARQLTGAEARQAARQLAALHRHHGDLTLHRLEELAGVAEKALAKAPPGGMLERQLQGDLARIHHMTRLAEERGVTGRVVKEPVPDWPEDYDVFEKRDVFADEDVDPGTLEPAAAKGLEVSPVPEKEAAPPLDLSDPAAVAAAVHEAGRGLPDAIGGHRNEGLADWESHKPLLADVYEALAPRLGGASLDDFKKAVVGAHAAGHLQLARNDLPAAVKDRSGRVGSQEAIDRVTRSEAALMNATFHTVDTNSEAARRAPPPPAAPAPAHTKADLDAMPEAGRRALAGSLGLPKSLKGKRLYDNLLARARPEGGPAAPASPLSGKPLHAAVEARVADLLPEHPPTSGDPTDALVPIWRLRRSVPASSRAEFDDAVRQLWRDGKVRMVARSTRDLPTSKTAKDQWDDAIEGQGETFFYVQPTAKFPGVAAKPAPAPSPADVAAAVRGSPRRTVADVHDAIRAAHPGLTLPDFHALLHRARREGLVSLGQHGDPASMTARERAAAIPPTPGGTAHLGFVYPKGGGAAAAPAPAPVQAPAPARDHPARVAAAFLDLDRKGGGNNFVTLVALKKATGLSVPELHAAVNDLRRKGVLTGSGLEGRHGISAEERETMIPEDGERGIGYVSARDHGKVAALAAATPAPARPRVADPEAHALDFVSPAKGHKGGLAPLWELKRRLGLPAEQFKDLLFRLDREDKVRLVAVGDRSRLTADQLADSIDGENETFAYAEPGPAYGGGTAPPL